MASEQVAQAQRQTAKNAPKRLQDYAQKFISEKKPPENPYISKTPSYLVVNFSTFQYLGILFDLVTYL